MPLYGPTYPRNDGAMQTNRNAMSYSGYFDIWSSGGNGANGAAGQGYDTDNNNWDDYFYPVVFNCTDNRPADEIWIARGYSQRPAPTQRNVSNNHFGGMTIRIISTNGGWDAGSNLYYVSQYFQVYHQMAGRAQLGSGANRTTCIWLRGGYRYWYTSTGPSPVVYGTNVGTEGDITTGQIAYYQGNPYQSFLVLEQSQGDVAGVSAATSYAGGNW